ncbi:MULTISPECIES: tyrosine-type recombinase/integrase [unclassified Oleiphilus]|uniref:tyrosine-type recombinase/integrase n=2 Tax=Oleiphilus TaxID=141450 RepID=UPI0007C211AD|nr:MULTISPECIES: tyrosine-type recombinase/integrase [unclassified Oleiphilus]KZY40308.1 hypothetical protein A3732_19965 [Oleiphilus sp. HI0050]KZY77152.1 hypothetical protein A3740_10955 [Oleiphilus sp. HI0068]KZY78544.1 hypothetical protein A3741_08420 [Oleiphilus sp. HI0069]KZZ32644.1 hypothetical protein A3755_09385 [Oleiphilus sp. HI0085]KZZ37091.1 hypothetical protein A3757_12530 [Oleiphilus sp. HI0117]
MRLIQATEDFKLNGQPYAEFPLIVDNEMQLVWEVHQFLVYYCITRGRVSSVKSWLRYGQDLYDYFSYLEANDLDWRASLATYEHSVIGAYRDWSIDLGLSPNTVNGRLRTIIKFYEYARRREWIDSVPYDIETIIISKPKGFLAHTDTSGGITSSPNVMLKEKKSRLKVLSKQEIKALLKRESFMSQHLVYRMALQTGMRKEELLTFPEKFIQDPAMKRGSSIVVVDLNPLDMKTKGSKARSIHIPIALYERLWQYKLHDRHGLLVENGIDEQAPLFLNRFGQPYSIKGTILNKELQSIVGRKGITLHSLRHTYATMKLYGLRNNPNYRGNPLSYIRDRLGHSSINTTEVYLHYLEELEGDVMTSYDDDVDQICSGLEVA